MSHIKFFGTLKYNRVKIKEDEQLDKYLDLA